MRSDTDVPNRYQHLIIYIVVAAVKPILTPAFNFFNLIIKAAT